MAFEPRGYRGLGDKARCHVGEIPDDGSRCEGATRWRATSGFTEDAFVVVTVCLDDDPVVCATDVPFLSVASAARRLTVCVVAPVVATYTTSLVPTLHRRVYSSHSGEA
jgi:hypothetical protein